MKTRIKFNIALIFIFSYSLTSSQIINTPAQWLAFQQSELKGSAFIIEGTITTQKSFSGRTGRMLCSMMQITKIFRGGQQIKLGTVKIISILNNKKAADAGPNIGRGRYIIFGKSANSSSSLDSLFTTDNTIILQTNDWVTFTGGGAVWGWRKVTHYATTADLYSFFNDNGVTIEEQASQPIMPKDSVK